MKQKYIKILLVLFVGSALGMAVWVYHPNFQIKNNKNSRYNLERFVFPKTAQIIGDPSAEVILYEFADFQCVFCKNFHDNTLPFIKEKYIDTGKLKLVFINFPFMGEESHLAAEAGKCAAEQNKFEIFHDELFSRQSGHNQSIFSIENLKLYAKARGLNEADFDSCMDGRKYDAIVEQELIMGKRVKIAGTPTFIIGDHVLAGSIRVSELEMAIEQEIQK